MRLAMKEWAMRRPCGTCFSPTTLPSAEALGYDTPSLRDWQIERHSKGLREWQN